VGKIAFWCNASDLAWGWRQRSGVDPRFFNETFIILLFTRIVVPSIGLQ
jgi:hypothetical protein